MVPWWDNRVACFRYRTSGKLFWALTATLRKFSMHIHLMLHHCGVKFAALFATTEGVWCLLCLYNSGLKIIWGKVPSDPASWWVKGKVEEQLKKLNVLVRVLKPLENIHAIEEVNREPLGNVLMCFSP